MKVRPFVPLLILLCPSMSSAGWPASGVGVTINPSTVQFSGIPCSDTFQGVIVPWIDSQHGGWSIFVQRVSEAGSVLWPSGGVYASFSGSKYNAPVAISDGAGGAFIVWCSFAVFAQHVSATGQVLWPLSGVYLCQSFPQWGARAVPDGSGGVIAAWTDQRNSSLGDIYAQHVNANGEVQWDADGLVISATPDAETFGNILPDDAGGAFIAYHKQNDVYAQRISGGGQFQWGSNGAPISLADNEQDYPMIAPDGAGGIIATWADARENAKWDVYVQRINGAGVPQWTIDGINLTTAPNGPNSQRGNPLIVSDGAGGAIVAWRGSGLDWYKNVYAQKVNAAGVPQWPGTDGMPIYDAGYVPYLSLAADGAGGAFLAWDASPGTYYDIYAQQIHATGNAQWPMNGIILSSASTEDRGASIVRSGDGAIVTWLSAELSGVPNGGILAQRIGGTAASVHETPPPAAISLGDFTPNPFASSTRVDLDLSHSSSVSVEVFDVSGRRMRAIELGRLRAGMSQITFDGLDERARALPSGVYFYRVHAGSETVTKKMVIAR